VKRFYKQAAVAPDGAGFAVQLDGRLVKTPGRNALCIPVHALAESIAAEWNGQGEEIDPSTMPLTALAEGALDQVVFERDRIVSRIAAFADSDMLYFRGDDSQPELVKHQAKHWDPLLDWARSRYDISFHLIHGIIHQSQPPETIERLTAAVEAQDDFSIAAMLSLAGLTGSLTITLALVEKAFDPDSLWACANLEELWQERQWGADDLAVNKRAEKETEYRNALLFLDLYRG